MRYAMRRAVSFFTAFLLLALLLTGCDENTGQYRIIDTLSTEEFALGFRTGDKVREPVEAILAAMQADGTVTALSIRWFGRDVSLIKGDPNAIFELEITPRIFIIGVDGGAPPMSYRDDYGVMRGFNVELAEEICRRLGWELQVIPINPANVDVELSSGNIDCALGSMSFVVSNERTEIGISYMENRKVLVTRGDSVYRRKSDLRGQDIGMTFDPASIRALTSDESLYASIRSYIQYTSSEQCYEALRNGDCAAILVDSVAVEFMSAIRIN